MSILVSALHPVNGVANCYVKSTNQHDNERDSRSAEKVTGNYPAGVMARLQEHANRAAENGAENHDQRNAIGFGSYTN